MYPQPSARELKGRPRRRRRIQIDTTIIDNALSSTRTMEECLRCDKAMRSNIVAPVDSMGSDSAQLKEKEPQVRHLPILPGRVLSNG